MFIRLIAILGILILSWGMTGTEDSPMCSEGGDTIGMVSSMADTISSAAHDEGGSSHQPHRDPCHRGICHFGHCAHVRLISGVPILKQSLAQDSKAQTPYYFHVPRNSMSRQERPPIA